MKSAAYLRRHDHIMDLATKTFEKFPSINKAKKRSRELQQKLDGNLGSGSVRRVEKFPPQG